MGQCCSVPQTLDTTHNPFLEQPKVIEQKPEEEKDFANVNTKIKQPFRGLVVRSQEE
jgi:hypothetical protein